MNDVDSYECNFRFCYDIRNIFFYFFNFFLKGLKTTIKNVRGITIKILLETQEDFYNLKTTNMNIVMVTIPRQLRKVQ